MRLLTHHILAPGRVEGDIDGGFGDALHTAGLLLHLGGQRLRHGAGGAREGHGNFHLAGIVDVDVVDVVNEAEFISMQTPRNAEVRMASLNSQALNLLLSCRALLIPTYYLQQLHILLLQKHDVSTHGSNLAFEAGK